MLDPDGDVLARAAQFEEELLVCEVPSPSPGPLSEPLSDLAEVYGALVLGLRDYVRKNGFRHVGLALSGGIDSALVALLAVDAVGPENVSCVVMPSPHSSPETQADARTIAANLGAEAIEIPIESTMASYEQALAPSFGAPTDGTDAEPLPRDPTRPSEPDLAAENIQARIRGNLMMALSNKHGWLVLTTGNKSEMSVGYATLYGDMAGGFAVIKDVPKTLVYELVRHRNEEAGRELVPASVLERAPSAELRPDQLDTDSLPPYELLDRVLEAYVERDEGREEMIAAGMPADVVDEVIRMVDRSEYKRRQAAPGIRITPKAFGRDRRLPITNRFGGNRSASLRIGQGTVTYCLGTGGRRSSSARARRAALPVVDLGVPDPGGAAAVAGARLDLGRALGDRADEADADRLAHRHHPVAEHGERRRPRADALDQGRHHAAVQEADRLAQLVAHLHPDPGVLGVVVEPLGAEQGVEVGDEVRAGPPPSRPDPTREAAPVGFPIRGAQRRSEGDAAAAGAAGAGLRGHRRPDGAERRGGARQGQGGARPARRARRDRRGDSEGGPARKGAGAEG